MEAILLLTQECVMPNDIHRASVMLNYFVIMFGSMYGERYMTINIHYLLHLSSDVQSLEPLWAYSCFPFENLNGELKHMFHGSRYIDTQILNALCSSTTAKIVN